MSYIEKAKGFDQRFDPPQPSRYLEILLPQYGNYERSKVSLSHIHEDIKAYQPTGKNCNDPYMHIAIIRAANAFMFKDQVEMLHLNDVFRYDLPIWSELFGFPWIQMNVFKKNEICDNPEHLNCVRWFWNMVKTGEDKVMSNCCAYVHAQLVEHCSIKAHAAWDSSATMVFGETISALPLIDEYLCSTYPIAYGQGVAKERPMVIIQSPKGSFFFRVEFKSFDKNVPEWLICTAFDILYCNSNFCCYQDHGVARIDAKNRMWDQIVGYFVNTPTRMCNEERYRKHSDIASESFFTQLIGSINYIYSLMCRCMLLIHCSSFLCLVTILSVGLTSLSTPTTLLKSSTSSVCLSILRNYMPRHTYQTLLSSTIDLEEVFLYEIKFHYYTL